MQQSFLASHDYLIAGMGINPYKPYITPAHVDFPIYNAVAEFLCRFTGPGTHNIPDFPAYISSVQTHLDISPNDLPKTATLFARLDFVRGLLFANSPDFDERGWLCTRDYYWSHSAFGLLGSNTGSVEECYNNLDQIAESFLTRGIFCRLRCTPPPTTQQLPVEQPCEKQYEIFAPVPLKEYFENPVYGACETDIKQFLSFRNIEITARGTLEVRSDCSQPIRDAFAPPAFSLGLAHAVDRADALLNEFLRRFQINESNGVLRWNAITGQSTKGVPDEELSQFLTQMVDVAADGLRSREKGEEMFVFPLYERAENLTNPAKEKARRLAAGELLEDIIASESEDRFGNKLI